MTINNIVPIRAGIAVNFEPCDVEPIRHEITPPTATEETRKRVEEWSNTIWLTAIKIGMRAGFDKAKAALEQALADIRAKADQQ